MTGHVRKVNPSGETNTRTLENAPVPVVLTAGTILKLIAGVVAPFLIIASGALVFYHQAEDHMANTVIHLGNGERSTLETKKEAIEARIKQTVQLNSHVDLRVRELQVEQRQAILDLEKTLTSPKFLSTLRRVR